MSIFLKIILDIDGEDLNPIGMNVFSTPSNSAVRVTLATMHLIRIVSLFYQKLIGKVYRKSITYNILRLCYERMKQCQDDNI